MTAKHPYKDNTIENGYTESAAKEYAAFVSCDKILDRVAAGEILIDMKAGYRIQKQDNKFRLSPAGNKLPDFCSVVMSREEIRTEMMTLIAEGE